MILANLIRDLLEAISNPFALSAVAVVCVFAADIAKRFMRHQERMAMIQAGMDPDSPKAAREESIAESPPVS